MRIGVNASKRCCRYLRRSAGTVSNAPKAQLGGWSTPALSGLSFYHHRKLGLRDGGRTQALARTGSRPYYMGYRFSYLLVRAGFHARHDPAALTMVTSYLTSTVKREQRYDDPAVRAHLRRRQGIRHLRARLREARGRSRPAGG